MDEQMQVMDAGDLELERRFEAYARARLSPDAAAVARIRARVLREARFHHEAARIAVHIAPAIEARRRPTLQRFAMPLLAAGIWLGILAGTVAAAHAGGPLYPTRLWLENATIPTSGPARVTAEIERLRDRVREALEAADNRDAPACVAALDAYATIAADATAAAGDDPVQLARVENALANHVAVLTAVAAGLADKGNDTAASVLERDIERAIEHNASVIANLTQHDGGPAAGTPPSGGGGRSGATGDQGGAKTGGGNDGNPSGAGGAAASPSPDGQVAAPSPSATTDGQGSGDGGSGSGGGDNHGGGSAGGASKASASPGAPGHTPRGGKTE